MTEFNPKDKLNNVLKVGDKVLYTRAQLPDVYIGTVTDLISDLKVRVMPFDSVTPPDTIYTELQDRQISIQLISKRLIKMSEAEYLEHKLKK